MDILAKKATAQLRWPAFLAVFSTHAAVRRPYNDREPGEQLLVPDRGAVNP